MNKTILKYNRLAAPKSETAFVYCLCFISYKRFQLLLGIFFRELKFERWDKISQVFLIPPDNLSPERQYGHQYGKHLTF